MSRTPEEIQAIISGHIFLHEAADLQEQRPAAEETVRAEVYRLVQLLREQQESAQIDVNVLDEQVAVVEDATESYVFLSGLERVSDEKAVDYRKLHSNWVLKKEVTDESLKRHFDVDSLPPLSPDVAELDLLFLFSPDDDE